MSQRERHRLNFGDGTCLLQTEQTFNQPQTQLHVLRVDCLHLCNYWFVLSRSSGLSASRAGLCVLDASSLASKTLLSEAERLPKRREMVCWYGMNPRDLSVM